MELPQGLKYSEDHLWVRIEGNDAVIGITDFAQEELGMIVFVELPELDETLHVGDPLGSMESVKTVSEFYAPVAGTVVQTNGDLLKNPNAVNLAPYGAGWLIRIRMSHPQEADKLWTADRYNEVYGHE